MSRSKDFTLVLKAWDTNGDELATLQVEKNHFISPSDPYVQDTMKGAILKKGYTISRTLKMRIFGVIINHDPKPRVRQNFAPPTGPIRA